MALVEKSHGQPLAAFSFELPAAGSRLLRGAVVLTGVCLSLAALYLVFSHGHWVAASWCAAAGLAWVFLRGAADASVPSSREALKEE